MFSFFKKKKIIPHIKLTGVIGNVGKFKQGIDFSGQEEIILKAFSLKKAPCVAITINSPGGSPVETEAACGCAPRHGAAHRAAAACRGARAAGELHGERGGGRGGG